MDISHLSREEFVVFRKQLLDKYVTKEFLFAFQEEVRDRFKLRCTYQIGDVDLYHLMIIGCLGPSIKKICKQFHAEELAEFYEDLDWDDSDDTEWMLLCDYALKYKFFQPKRRWRNICKADKMLPKTYY